MPPVRLPSSATYRPASAWTPGSYGSSPSLNDMTRQIRPPGAPKIQTPSSSLTPVPPSPTPAPSGSPTLAYLTANDPFDISTTRRNPYFPLVGSPTLKPYQTLLDADREPEGKPTEYIDYGSTPNPPNLYREGNFLVTIVKLLVRDETGAGGIYTFPEPYVTNISVAPIRPVQTGIFGLTHLEDAYGQRTPYFGKNVGIAQDGQIPNPNAGKAPANTTDSTAIGLHVTPNIPTASVPATASQIGTTVPSSPTSIPSAPTTILIAPTYPIVFTPTIPTLTTPTLPTGISAGVSSTPITPTVVNTIPAGTKTIPTNLAPGGLTVPSAGTITKNDTGNGSGGEIDPCKNSDPCMGNIKELSTAAKTAAAAAAAAAAETAIQNAPTSISYDVFTKCDDETPQYSKGTMVVPFGMRSFCETMLNDLAKLRGQQCSEKTAIATVPDSWTIKAEFDRPQTVIVYRKVSTDGTLGKDYYPLTIPHSTYTTKPTTKPKFRNHEKGNWQGLLKLKDGSAIIVYSKTKVEAQAQIDEMLLKVKDEKKTGKKPTFTEHPPGTFAEFTAKAWKLDHYPNGLQPDVSPAWSIRL